MENKEKLENADLPARPKPIFLLLIEGWGVTEKNEANAISVARTPNLLRLVKDYPAAILETNNNNINSRYLNIGYWKYFAHMVLSILPFIVLAYIAHFLNYYVLHLLDLSLNTFLTFLLSGIFYTLFTFIFLVIFPLIAGLHRKDINKIIHIKFKL